MQAPPLHTALPLHRVPVAYALDVDGPSLLLLRSENKRGRITHRPLWQGDMPLTDQDRQALDSAWALCRGERAPLVAALTASESITQTLRAPFASVRKATHIFPSLLDVQLPFPLTACTYAFLQIRVEADQVKALAVAARHATIQNKLDWFARITCDPRILLHEGLTVFRHTARQMPPAPEEQRITALIALHHSLLLFSRGGRYEAAYALDSGLRQLEDPTHQALSAWPQRAARVIRSFDLDLTCPVHWLWCGPGAPTPPPLPEPPAQLPWHVHTLKASDHLTAEALNTEVLTPSETSRNFRSGELTHPATIRQYQRPRRLARLLLYAIGCFCLAGSLAWRAQTTRYEGRLDRHIARLVSETTALDVPAPRGHEVAFVNNILHARRTAHRIFFDTIEPHAPALLHSLIEGARTHQASLHALRIDRDACVIRGSTASRHAAEALETILQEADYHTHLELRARDALGMTHFTLRGTRHD